MSKLAKISLCFFVLFALLVVPATAMAQEAGHTAAPVVAAKAVKLTAVGIGIVIIGAAIGIGQIGARAVESMARQPEIADKIQTAMIISAALVEGATVIGLVFCFLELLF